jgi:hypothetical protein
MEDEAIVGKTRDAVSRVRAKTKRNVEGIGRRGIAAMPDGDASSGLDSVQSCSGILNLWKERIRFRHHPYDAC